MGIFAGPERNFTIQSTSGRSLYSSGVVQDGLVLHLDVGKFYSYPKSGTTLTDLSGNGNTGTLINEPTYNSEDVESLVFDGVDDAVATSYGPQLNDFTVIAWFRSTGGTQDYNRIVDKDYINGLWIGRQSNISNSWGGGVLESSAPYGRYITLPDGQWNMITSVRQGTSHTIYGNGTSTSVSGTVSSTALSTTTFAFGNYSGINGPQRLTGNISNIQIYNRALTESEIQQNYNALKERHNNIEVDGSTAEAAAPSASYLVSLGITTNGFYYINLPTLGPTQIYCILDPAVDGGGWMVLWGAASGSTNLTYSFSASRDDISISPINGFYSLSYAKRSAVNALCTQNKTLVYGGTNSNWLRFDGYIWNSNSHTSGNFRFEFNTSLVTSNGTVDSSVEVGLTNYNVSGGGDFGIAINTNGLDHHNGNYYNLNSGCASMYLYQYGAGYKVNTGLSGWYNQTTACTIANSNNLPLLVAMK